MKSLALKLLVFAVLLTGLLSLLVIAPLPPNHSSHALVTKHRIIKGVKGRKIILIGGSGALYSFNSATLEREFPGYRVVNMGFNGGLGLKFNLDEVKPYLGPGDLIVISPEYGNFTGAYGGLPVAISTLTSLYPDIFAHIEKRGFWSLSRADMLNLLQVKAQSYLDTMVLKVTNSSLKINDHGDIASQDPVRDVSTMAFAMKHDAAGYGACVVLLREFQDYCAGRGARAFFSFPSIPRPQYEKELEQLDYLYRQLTRDAPLPILHPPEMSVYAPECFVDTIYHLNMKGRELRTQYLAGLLKEFVQK